MDETLPPAVIVRPKRPLRDYRLWAWIGVVMASLIVAASMYVLISQNHDLRSRVNDFDSAANCYRLAAADTTAASARVQVDLATFVTEAIQRHQTEHLLGDLTTDKGNLDRAIQAQLAKLHSCGLPDGSG